MWALVNTFKFSLILKIASRNVFLSILLIYGGLICTFRGARSTQLIPSRPHIEYLNSKYVENVSLTCYRPSRNAPYLVDLHATTKQPWGDNVTLKFIIYEFLSNEYRRSFIEGQYKICQLVKKEKWIGKPLYRAGLQNYTCPYPAIRYHLVNMSVSSADLPLSFHMDRARVNLELFQTDGGDTIGTGHIDLLFRDSLKKRKQTKLRRE